MLKWQQPTNQMQASTRLVFDFKCTHGVRLVSHKDLGLTELQEIAKCSREQSKVIVFTGQPHPNSGRGHEQCVSCLEYSDSSMWLASPYMEWFSSFHLILNGLIWLSGAHRSAMHSRLCEWLLTKRVHPLASERRPVNAHCGVHP